MNVSDYTALCLMYKLPFNFIIIHSNQCLLFAFAAPARLGGIRLLVKLCVATAGRQVRRAGRGRQLAECEPLS